MCSLCTMLVKLVNVLRLEYNTHALCGVIEYAFVVVDVRDAYSAATYNVKILTYLPTSRCLIRFDIIIQVVTFFTLCPMVFCNFIQSHVALN